jgi:soluble lytic murein transglycosylase
MLSDRADCLRYPQEYSELVTKYSADYGVPEYVIYATIKTESNFDSGAQSEAGALGLMQIMPDTFDWLVSLMQDGYETGMLYDPETNIKYGTYYLSYLYLRYSDWETAFAAYNAGPTVVDSWLSDSQYVDENGKLQNIPYDETSKYVKKMAKAVETYQRLYYNS